MDKNADTVKVLNELLEVSEDGKKGFSEAAHDAKDERLKTLFRNGSEQCESAVGALSKLVTNLGGKHSQGGSVTAAAHRGWVKVKSKIEDSNLAVLEEVERGQDHAKSIYAKALKADLPSNVRKLVQRQYEGVVRYHDQVRDLRNQYKAAA